VNYNSTHIFIYLSVSSVIVWCDAEHKRVWSCSLKRPCSPLNHPISNSFHWM